LSLRQRLGALLVAGALAASCAPKAPAPRLPDTEDYVFPSAGRGELSPAEVRKIEEAWKRVLAGDPAGARGFEKLLQSRPKLVPATTGLAYARLRGGRAAEASRLFQIALDERSEYLPALVGAGSAALRQGDADAALAFYRLAQTVAPGDAVVRRRLPQIKLQVTEKRVAQARQDLERGNAEKATTEYRAALDAAPEVGGVRLELANLLLAQGDAPGAVALLEQDPVGDRQVLLRQGEILIGMQDYARAIDVYRRLLVRDPRDEEALRRSREVRDAQELLLMPEEYRRIATAPRLTRADLAALMDVKVAALRRVAEREPKVAIDISGSWARDHIADVLALDIMDVYPNHTFQPGAMVRRSDVARALGRVLDLLRWPRAASASVPSDMSPANVAYDRVERVLGAGLMDVTPAGAFEPWRPVTGPEAIDAIEALVRLVGT
jgi:tetratricopeptide (TPR) repeat protein